MKYYCKNCSKYWNIPAEKCIFCGFSITPVENLNFRIIGSTKVFIPSKGNEDVPYYVYLLEDDKGQKSIKKSHNEYNLGELMSLDETEVQKINMGIVGTGLMGSQIAEYLVTNGYGTVLKTRKKSEDDIRSNLEKKLSKGLSTSEVTNCLKNLLITSEYSDLYDCDIIIEASVEDLEIKKEIFKRLSHECKESAILATNSSSISIDEIASVTGRPEKCIGMHFFNPVKKMDLIEVIIGEKTSEETKNRIVEFSKNIRKQPIIVRNNPGFVVNRLLLPQINDAIHLFEEGVASKEDIDSAVKLGLNHPMGPFELADFIGLDICLSILEVLNRDLNDERLKPAITLHRLVEEGKLGYKSGEGFYKY